MASCIPNLKDTININRAKSTGAGGCRRFSSHLNCYDSTRTGSRQGDMVIWVNADTAPHTITSGAGIDEAESGKLFDSGSLGQAQKFSMPAEELLEDQAGTNIDYYCTVRPFMKGKITVQ
jgi:plastocyanin